MRSAYCAHRKRFAVIQAASCEGGPRRPPACTGCGGVSNDHEEVAKVDGRIYRSGAVAPAHTSLREFCTVEGKRHRRRETLSEEEELLEADAVGALVGDVVEDCIRLIELLDEETAGALALFVEALGQGGWVDHVLVAEDGWAVL